MLGMFYPHSLVKRLIVLASISLVICLTVNHRLVTAQSLLSNPVLLPGDQTITPAAGTQESPQIARGANGYLAVWSEERTVLSFIADGFGGPYLGRGLGSMRDIYAARLDASGNVLDTTPIIISQAQYNQDKPRVGWNGQNYLVAWTTQQGDQYNYEIRAVRVAPNGTVLDPTPLIIESSRSGNISFPTNIITDGTNWIVVWENFSRVTSLSRAVFAQRVSPSGAMLDGVNGREIYRHTSQYLDSPDLAFGGNGYLLTFVDMSAGPQFEDLVKGVRLSINLDQLSAPFRINLYSPTKAFKPRVSSNGTDYLVVWDDHPFSGNIGQLIGARVSGAGQVLDPGGITIISNVGTSQTKPSICWDGTYWFVSYDSSYNGVTGTYGTQDVYAVRVSTTGAVLDPNGIPVKVAPGTQIETAIAPGLTGGAYVVWYDIGAAAAEEIQGAAVSTAGAVGPEVTVSLGAPRQSKPRIAPGGGGFMVVYRSEVSGDARILAQPLDGQGNPIGQAPVVIASGDPSLNNPSVAWNNSVFLVVWDKGGAATTRQVFGRRVSSTGAVLDPAPILIMAGETPDVAALGDTFLVVDIRQIGSQLRYVEAVRVSGAGAVLGPPVTVLTNFNFAPRVAALGGRWLVVWEYHSRYDQSLSWIRGSFVSADGAPTPSFQVADGENPLSSGISYDDTPHLAVSGNEALIVWADADIDDNDIKGRRITADGTLLDSRFGFYISNAPNDQLIPAVAWDGTQYLSDWVDHRNEGYPQQPRGDIYGARVGSTGTVLDPSGFTVANSQLPEETPFVAAINGFGVFAYAAFNDRAPYAAFRITLRTTGSPTPPTDPIQVALSRDASNNLRATITITNPLPDPVPGVTMTLVRASTLDGSAFVDGVSVPQSFGTLNSGQSVTATVTFPGTASVPSGFSGLVRVDLSYTGGTYTDTKQVVTP